MVHRNKNILLGMSANEKRYMRLIEEHLRGKYHKSEIPERKREALEDYREKVRKQCAPCLSEIADREVAKLANRPTPVFKMGSPKKAKKAEEEEE